MAEAITAAQHRGIDEVVVEGYKPLSGLGLVSLFLGVLSVLVLFDLGVVTIVQGQQLGSVIGQFLWGIGFPLLGFLPLLAILCGLLTLRQIRRRRGELGGARLARIGITLAVVFAAGGVINYHLPQYEIVRRAKAVGYDFLQALAEDQPERAARLMMMPTQRPPEDTSRELFAKDRALRDYYRRLVGTPVVPRMAELGSKAWVRFHSVDSATLDDTPPGINLVFAVTNTAEPDRSRRTFLVVLKLEGMRNPYKDGQWDWAIMDGMAPYTPGSVPITRRSYTETHQH